MPLSAGTRLGPYEVIARLGVGGMGEVWRASDTNLGRQVAIKVLPDAFAQDAERLARFEREAKTLATLNHPNIAAIYGLEKAGGVRALVMELVEGPTLADRIARGPLSVEEALAIANQIAEALEAAHERGIIHRDLKPANVKVRDDGTVKVLDFGLAKAVEPAAASVETSLSPTITSPAMTQMGMILGTAAYMAPEQAKGRSVDARADVWAFGAVLFEMLSGRRAFDGEDVTEILGAVVRLEPTWEALPPDVPARIRLAIRGCLQKHLKQRIAHIQDVRLALEGVFDTTTDQMIAAAPVEQPPWRRALPLAAALFVGGFIVGLAAWSLRPTAATPVVTRFDDDVPTDQPFRSTGRTVLALSRDGRAFVYNAEGGLYLRTMDTLAARPIPGTQENLANPFFSPDGRWLGFFQGGQLKRIPVGGGAAVAICPAMNPFGASWEADGTILFGQPKGIMRVSAEGGAPQLVIPAADGERVHGPQLLPDADSVLFTATTATWDEARIVVQSLSTGARKVLVEGGRDSHYVQSGHLLYVQGDDLFAKAFDVNRLAFQGGTVSIVGDLTRSSAQGTLGPSSVYAVSDGGTLVYLTTPDGERSQLTWFDRTGTVLGTFGEPGFMRSPDLSHDGRRVAVARRDPSSAAVVDIWVVDALRTTKATSGAGPHVHYFPIWSPDGSRIAYLKTSPEGRQGQYAVPSRGGTEEVIVADPAMLNLTSWSRDGRFILVDKAPVDIWVIPAAGDGKPFPFIDGTPYQERDGQFSPDGRWVAYQSNETGRAEIYVRPFVAPGDPRPRTGQWPISTDGGAQPRWRHDGKELYWIAPDATLISAPIALRADTVDAGAPVRLFSTRIAMGGAEMSLSGQYTVAPNGRFLINAVVDDQHENQSRFHLVQNWFEELNRLLPTN
jgi:Tol biopolymer transport system component